METRHDPDPEERLPIGEAARIVGVSVDTLRRWTKEGRVSAAVGPGGHRRFRRGDVEALLKETA